MLTILKSEKNLKRGKKKKEKNNKNYNEIST
jgi:hypothetical protein